MAVRYVALLRAISNVPMAPFRAALEELGYADVRSFGMSGNLMFTAASGTTAAHEAAIEGSLGRVTLVRTARQMATIVRADPFAGRKDAAVLFTKRPPSAAQRAAFLALEPAEPRPVLRGSVLHFAGWVTVGGRRVDLEKVLGQGTIRAAAIVRRLAEEMS